MKERVRSSRFKEIMDYIKSSEYEAEQRVKIKFWKENTPKDFIIGELFGEIMWLKCIPTISTGGVYSRNLIQVNPEDTEEQERLSSIWSKIRQENKNESKQAWDEYRNFAKSLQYKYLPKEVSYSYMIPIDNEEDFKKGLISNLWNQDGCDYSLDMDDIKIEYRDYLVTVKLKLDDEKL